MYALHVSAVPDGSDSQYTAGKPYPVFLIVEAASEALAIELAEQTLREKGWKDLQVRQIEAPQKDKEIPGVPLTEPLIYVFSDAEQARLQKLSEQAKALHDGLEP